MGADTIHIVGEDKLTSTDGFGVGTSVGSVGFGSSGSTQAAKEMHIQGFAYKCKK